MQDIDHARQAQAREYARIRRRLWALELLFGAAYLLAWIVLKWGHRVQNLADQFPWPITLLFVAMSIGFPWLMLTAPLSYYRGFVLPHRYKLSTQSFRAWIIDNLKGFAVAGAIGAPLLIGLYAVIRFQPTFWWIWSGVGFNLFSVVLTALGPVILLPIFFTQEPLQGEHDRLRQRLMDMASSVGAKVRGVYRIDMSRRTKAANAALAGLAGSRRILLGDTLLETFSEDEVEAVLAHELGHHVHHDLPLSILVQSGFNFVAFFAVYLVILRAIDTMLLEFASDPAGLPLLMLAFSTLSVLVMPVSNAFSRWRERLADRFALEITQRPLAFSSAMKRLANQNLADIDPERWVVLLLYSHPPLDERIKMAEAFPINA
jgi:STE24 endopeptidase